MIRSDKMNLKMFAFLQKIVRNTTGAKCCDCKNYVEGIGCNSSIRLNQCHLSIYPKNFKRK